MPSCAYSSWCDCITTHLGEFYIYCSGSPPVWENEGEYANTIYVDGEEWTPEWEDTSSIPTASKETGYDQLPSAITKATENIVDLASTFTDYVQNKVSTAVDYTSETVKETTPASVMENVTISQDILRKTEVVWDGVNQSVSNVTDVVSELAPDMTQIKQVADDVVETVKSAAKDAVHNIAGNLFHFEILGFLHEKEIWK